ncbi:MAG: adenine phosphoribosyltransferase [Bacteroidaceae bacterium]|nr:adenine phosphoribosyltransferase [Bacteroidaceae bacterium]
MKQDVRNVPDFPKPGIQFKDITTIIDKPEDLRFMLESLTDCYRDKGITKVVGIESRGFIMGAILARRLGAGLVMCRKPGKLPAETVSQSFEKEYGTDTIEIHKDSIDENDVVLIHDDLLATGGTIKAAWELVKKFNPKKCYMNFIIEIRDEGLYGRENIGDGIEVTSLICV